MSTERMENESEAECDLILVDREAWLAAENLRVEKEKEGFDYDSDDTVVLKSRIDSLKGENSDMVMDTLKEETAMDISDEGSPNKSSRKSLQKGATPRKDNGNEEDVEENVKNVSIQGKSGTKKSDSVSSDENNEHSVSKLNTSSRKSIEKRRLSKSLQVEEIAENSNESLSNSKLNQSASLDSSLKKRKSLNKSVEVHSRNSDAHNTSLSKGNKNKSVNEDKEMKSQPESAKKRKSLNKSASKEDERNKTVDLDSDDTMSSNKKDKSLNNTLTKKIKPKKLDIESSDESSNESKNSEHSEDKHETSMTKQNKAKKKYQRNYSTLVHVGTDSDVSADNIDSDSNDSKNQSMKIPNFLFAGGSSDDSDSEDGISSNQSIDSDIKREYNLDGENISKFSDDDVPGDECRASESESSDPDDNGSDLADFVVDDDEVEDEEEGQDREDDDGKESGEEEIEDDEGEEVKANENDQEDEDMVEGDVADVKTDTQKSDAEDNSEEEDQNEIKENSEDEEVNVEDSDSDSNDKEVVSKSLNMSKKDKNQLEKSTNSLSSQTPQSAKKKKYSEHNLDASLISNSSKKKKMKQKEEETDETVEESVEPQLNESAVVFPRSINKLHQSTPKSSISKQGKFETSIQSPSGVLETSRRKSISKIQEDDIENISPAKLQSMNMSLITDKSTKKLSKVKNDEKLLHKSLPTDLIELVEKTNLSRPMSSKITELNRTMFIQNSETPTTKYLKKDKLNESAPASKIRNDSKKLIKSRLSNEWNSMLVKAESEDISADEVATVSTQSPNASVKRKSLLNESNDTAHNESKKKHKKLKQSSVEKSGLSQSAEEESQEDVYPQCTEKKGKHSSSISLDKNDMEEISESSNKKKRKKKKKKKTSVEVQEAQVEENASQDTADDKSQTADEVIVEQNKKKKKKKDKTKKEDVSEYTGTDAESYVSEKKKKKKKQKMIEQLEEEPLTILSKKKKKSVKDVSSKPKIESRKMSKAQSSNMQSDSDDAPETVAFSRAREEALEVLKQAADNIKANKEVKKKKQKEHLERVQREREAKIQKLESKQQSSKANKVEVTKKGIKRLPDEVLENLSDVPSKPVKKRKLLKKENQILPSRSMFDSASAEIQNIHVDDNFIALSSCGGTTQFGVVNLQKMKKKLKKSSAVTSFRQKMLARNQRQPVSAYLMYMEKQKTSGKNKF